MKENDVTTLNAKANTAYNDLIAKTERENPGDVWAGFLGDQDAFETGFEAGYEAAAVLDREALLTLLDDYAVGRHVPEDAAQHRAFIADAVLTLIKGGAK